MTSPLLSVILLRRVHTFYHLLCSQPQPSIAPGRRHGDHLAHRARQAALPYLLQQPLRLLSRRVRLHILRQSPGLGLRRPAPADSLSHPPQPRHPGRLPAQHSLHPGVGFVPSRSANRHHRPRVRRTPLRPAPERDRHCHRSAISFQRKPARHQLPRTQSLDGLCLFRHPRHQAGQSALLALVRRGRRTRHGREILYRRIRLRHCHRSSPDGAAPCLPQSLDLAGRPCRFFDFSSESALELALSLAVRRADAEHPRRRPRCRAPIAPIFPSADVLD